MRIEEQKLRKIIKEEIKRLFEAPAAVTLDPVYKTFLRKKAGVTNFKGMTAIGVGRNLSSVIRHLMIKEPFVISFGDRGTVHMRVEPSSSDMFYVQVDEPRDQKTMTVDDLGVQDLVEKYLDSLRSAHLYSVEAL